MWGWMGGYAGRWEGVCEGRWVGVRECGWLGGGVCGGVEGEHMHTRVHRYMHVMGNVTLQE